MRLLRDLFSAEAQLAALIDRRRQEIAVLDRLRGMLPPAVARQTGVADATRPELVLATTTGAVATLVRHRAPELLEGLAREGWKFTGIRVKVQAAGISRHISKVYARKMDGRSVAALRAGAKDVRDPALAAALRRLAERGADASKGDHQPLEGVEQKNADQKK